MSACKASCLVVARGRRPASAAGLGGPRLKQRRTKQRAAAVVPLGLLHQALRSLQSTKPRPTVQRPFATTPCIKPTWVPATPATRASMSFNEAMTARPSLARTKPQALAVGGHPPAPGLAPSKGSGLGINRADRLAPCAPRTGGWRRVSTPGCAPRPITPVAALPTFMNDIRRAPGRALPSGYSSFAMETSIPRPLAYIAMTSALISAMNCA